MNPKSSLSVGLPLVLLALGAAACGDSDSSSAGSGGGAGGTTTTTGGDGGAGGSTTSSTASSTTTVGSGGGGGSPSSILGTTHQGDCSSAQSFAEACELAGGVLGDSCQNTTCGGPAYRATCFEPPPEPGADEFSCDGLFNCAVGEACRVYEPPGDGCYDHTCEPIPAACADDPSCECLVAELDAGDCELDEDGNPRYVAIDP